MAVRTITQFRAERSLRQIARDVSQDEALSKLARAYLFLYGSKRTPMPDDASWGAGRSLPAAVQESAPDPGPLELAAGIGKHRRRIPRWLVPVTWGALALGTCVNLAVADEPGSRVAEPPRQPGYTSFEKTVLNSPDYLRTLGLCPEILQQAWYEQLENENNARASTLANAITVSQVNVVDCVPDATAIYIPAGKGAAVVTAAGLVGDAAPSMPASPPPAGSGTI